MLRHLILPLLFLHPLTGLADWYQAEGSAPLSLGEDSARQQALEQALADTLLQAGASLTTVQSVNNGMFSGQRLDIAAQGELMDYLILNERRAQGRLWLTVRADIWPNQDVQPQCVGRYRPGLTLSTLPLSHPEQGQIGRIYELGDAVTQRLAQRLGSSVNLMTQLPHQLTTDPRLPRSPGLRQGGDILARQQQSRLLLSGVIEDISMNDGNWVDWRFREQPRQFQLSVTLEDGLTGETLLQQRYQAQSPWTFKKHAKVDVYEQGFWQSAYGQAVDQLLARVARDLVQAQSCMKAVGNILQQSEEGILMDLGRQAGIQVGDRFTLVHRRQLQPGYYSETSAQAQFVVSQSHPDYSLLIPADGAARQVRVGPGDILTQR
ncbi:flagellar assembly protein T N-terminal domain-containing protein [Zobellella sp. An-6]|uniref:flagellar assembly protein T N-terminal domain-containing protein n=1 Tax=Zobellella sp. An-6 TaxID=3400218 RepID=UPI00404308F8